MEPGFLIQDIALVSIYNIQKLPGKSARFSNLPRLFRAYLFCRNEKLGDVFHVY